MIVHRLAKEKYKADLSGFGAYKFGGRWNNKGVSILYTSESRALCLAEIIIYFDMGISPEQYYLLEIYIPEDLVEYIQTKDLPHDWHSFPYNLMTRKIGDQFVYDQQFLALRVPSAVVNGDYNYLINPNHPEFKKVKTISASPFPIDKRLYSIDL